MIEMRIVEIGDGCRPEFQYRHIVLITDAWTGSVYNKGTIWSEWKTAEWVKAEEIEND